MYNFFWWPSKQSPVKRIQIIPEGNGDGRIGQAKTLILVNLNGLIHDIGIPMLKKIVFPLVSLFLAYQSMKLVGIIVQFAPGEITFVMLFLLAFLLNLFVTGVFAFVGFTYPTSSLLPDAYYQPRNPERLKYVCDLLGVKYFKLALLLAFWGKEGNRKKYFNGTKSGIANFEFQTRQSEFGHLGGLVVVLAVSIVLLVEGHYMFFVLANFINVVANLYPILLQRMHRAQIGRIMAGINAE